MKPDLSTLIERVAGAGGGDRVVTATRYPYPARTPLPPGYAVEYWDEDEMWHWVLKSAPDDVYGGDTWDHWRCWRGAWAHYRAALLTALSSQQGADDGAGEE